MVPALIIDLAIPLSPPHTRTGHVIDTVEELNLPVTVYPLVQYVYN